MSVKACFLALVLVCAVVVTPPIDLRADSVITTIEVGHSPWDVVINPTGTFAYVTNIDSNTVSKINLATDTVVATITIGSSPRGIEINPTGTFAYVVNNTSNTVSKINLATDTVISTIAVGTRPSGVAINPAGTFAYVTNTASNTVSKIDLASEVVVSTISVGSFPLEVAINPAGTFAYVTNLVSNTVSKIDLASEVVVSTIAVTTPYAIAFNPAGTFAYVTSQDWDAVAKINLTTDKVVKWIGVGKTPTGVAINPAGTFGYVTNFQDTSVSKINLVSDRLVSSISHSNLNQRMAINPAGTFAYVTSLYYTVKKIALTAAEPQSIVFPKVENVLHGESMTGGALLSATADSNLEVVFTSSTPTVCTVSGTILRAVSLGVCTINANQPGGSGWDAASQVSQTFRILRNPPQGETGISIQNGDSYVNTKQITLNLIWPRYAIAVRISNDGGFKASKTQRKELDKSIVWELDDSVKGIYTKVVYARFSFCGLICTSTEGGWPFNDNEDSTTYSDDIILDTTAPIIESSSAAETSGSIDVSLEATDDLAGVDEVEIKTGTTTISKDYDKKLSLTKKELGLTVNSLGVKKFGGSSIKIRVSDKAGNWSAYKTLSVLSAPVVTTRKTTTAVSLARYAKLAVPSKSKISLKVVTSYAKYCKVVGTTLRGVNAGLCKVTVTVTPKKGKASSRTIQLKVLK